MLKKEKSKLTSVLQISAILVLLVILPAIALFFSTSGLALNKRIKSEIKLLKDSIPAPTFSLLDYNNRVVADTNLSNYLKIVQFVSSDCSSDCEQHIKYLVDGQKEFAMTERKNMRLVTHFINASPAELKALIQKHNIDTLNWKVVAIPVSQAAPLSKAYRLDSPSANQICMVSDQGYLCNTYDLAKAEDRATLPAHIVVMVKKSRREKIEYRPEQDPYSQK